MAIIFAPLAQIRIVRGTAWVDDVQMVDKASGNPIDLTGITGIVMRVRKGINTPILMELSTDEGNLVVLTPAEGRIGFRVNSAGTLALPENSNRKAIYIYDAVIERSAGEYEAAVVGKLAVIPSITRPWGTT